MAVATSLKREACLIDGQWVTNGAWMDVDDPATGQVIGRVPMMGGPEAKSAIEAARSALPHWSALAAHERAALLRTFAHLMIDRADALARLLSAEQGKPHSEALGEIHYSASYLDWFSEEARRIYGEIVPGHQRDKRIFVLRQPIGVVAAITPWNFPAAMVTRKIGPALAVGCTIILKPAEQTPFTALAIGALAEEAGLPKGVLNIVTGDPVGIGATLTASPEVQKLSFTGSTATGAKLMAQCAPTIKKVSLELGGNAPFIVFGDADIEAAVQGAIASKFRNAGQTCICTNRLFIQREIYECFAARFTEATCSLVVAPASDPNSQIGPLIDQRAMAKVKAHIADAVSKGAFVATGGVGHAEGENFFTPTVLTHATADMCVMQEETFGPVAALASFDNEEDLIKTVNASPFGLAAYIYTRDVSRAWRVSEKLETGMVGINTGLISTEVAPFGGVKASGLGREGGRQGIDDYVETKYICLHLDPPSAS
ncbi:NAD-dependent succinate-semialdehyde dehydrogenase [Sphingomonas bisphenolicum]|uniref:Succinate-semialdehyde dehydrogenase [NADP(+)] GabD n=1 Tax=Sphingomonas bisphenolicum TaxID=296544 RepID=A0ABM7G800_9SPHN|nr:NAD-dependent succinate-semialdehyde dehydrogenase [Sphingomonas bisphenolicum]BBF72023.1 succinate-semialdehyde dehydrogenase [NADP(+)] GabD [Sphingomonas bisphenolicum]